MKRLACSIAVSITLMFSIVYAAPALDAGPPRTVRMIYFLPKDRHPQVNITRMKIMMSEAQLLYEESMSQHGYPNMTFQLETGAQSQLIVHQIHGSQNDEAYHEFYTAEGFRAITEEIGKQFDLTQNVYVAVLDLNMELRGGAGEQFSKVGGIALVTGNFNFDIIIHELGHAFGLIHDFRNEDYIMSYGPGQIELSACNADFLAVHPYFNSNSSVENQELPSVIFDSPMYYIEGADIANMRFLLSDSDGLHQVILFLNHPFNWLPIVRDCQKLNGEKEATVNFQYDGDVYSYNEYSSSTGGPSVLEDFDRHLFRIDVIDVNGDVYTQNFTLLSQSPYFITSIEAHKKHISDIKFMPNGNEIVSASRDNTIMLWDIETYQGKKIFEGDSGIYAVEPHPNGRMLAFSGHHGLKIWHLPTGTEWTYLSDREKATSLAYQQGSMRNPLLASATLTGVVTVWNVLRERPVKTFYHKKYATHVSFSPDGNILASASDDNTAKLWDIKTGREIKTFRHGRRVTAAVFSPDGKVLVTGMSDRTAKVWDLETGQNIYTLGESVSGVSPYIPVFLPNSTILACHNHRDIMLVDITTGKTIETLSRDGPVGLAGPISQMIFSPDGNILANSAWARWVDTVLENGKWSTKSISGHQYYIQLWDTSKWNPMAPAPRTYLKEDLNRDDVINVLDLIIMSNAMNTNSMSINGVNVDLNNDSKIDILDLVAVSNAMSSQ